MPFTKGDKNIWRGGRKKGQPNISTEQIRSIFAMFLENNLDDIQSIYDQLEPVQKLSFIERIAKLILPAPLHEIDRLPDDQFEELVSRLRNDRHCSSPE